MSPASTLAALVTSACAALEALADADAVIVRACARGEAAPDLDTPRTVAARMLRGVAYEWDAHGWQRRHDGIAEPPWPVVLGERTTTRAFADALDAGAGIRHAAAYADGLRAWWAEAERCFEDAETVDV